MQTFADYWWEAETRTKVEEDYPQHIKRIIRRKPASPLPLLVVMGSFPMFRGSALFKAVRRVGQLHALPFAEATAEDLNSPGSQLIKWSPQSEYSIALDERARLPATKRVLNDTHFICDKQNVHKVFSEVANYDTAVDPLTYSGPAVVKSNVNASHSGRIVSLPSSTIPEGFVCERLLDNSIGRNLVFDIRLGVLMGVATHAYIKFRHLHQRFENVGTQAFVFSPSDLLSAEEIRLCLRFCERIGLDYGELDIIRDRATNMIYIVDANNTPAGPPKALTPEGKKAALEAISKAFLLVVFKGAA